MVNVLLTLLSLGTGEHAGERRRLDHTNCGNVPEECVGVVTSRMSFSDCAKSPTSSASEPFEADCCAWTSLACMAGTALTGDYCTSSMDCSSTDWCDCASGSSTGMGFGRRLDSSGTCISVPMNPMTCAQLSASPSPDASPSPSPNDYPRPPDDTPVVVLKYVFTGMSGQFTSAYEAEQAATTGFLRSIASSYLDVARFPGFADRTRQFLGFYIEVTPGSTGTALSMNVVYPLASRSLAAELFTHIGKTVLANGADSLQAAHANANPSVLGNVIINSNPPPALYVDTFCGALSTLTQLPMILGGGCSRSASAPAVTSWSIDVNSVAMPHTHCGSCSGWDSMNEAMIQARALWQEDQKKWQAN